MRVREVGPDDWVVWRLLRQRSLLEDPQAFAASVERWTGDQDREENWRAMQAYKPRPYGGRITLFKAMTASDKVEWPEDYGWTEFAGAGLEIVPVPGRHLTLFDDENVGSLARALASKLD